MRRGYSVRFARAQGPALCVAVGIPFLIAAPLVPWAWLSVLCFTVYLLLLNVAGGGYWAVPLELSPRLVGAISGVMNGSGNFAGIFGPMTAGFIIREMGNWTLPFLIAAFFAVISVLVFYFLVVPEPLTVKEPVPQTVPRRVGA